MPGGPGIPGGRSIGGAAVVAIAIALLLSYRLAAGTGSSWVAGTVFFAQIAVVSWLLSRKMAILYRAVLLAAALVIMSAAFVCPGLPIRSVGLAVGGLCHAAAYGSLLVWFSASLRPGREPVITGFARQLRPTMPVEVVRYTRRVTIAWCVFFAGQLLVSALLLIAAPLVVWSLFVSLLNLPLIVGMMLGEFVVRLVLFRREVRTGLFATLAGLRRVRGLPCR